MKTLESLFNDPKTAEKFYDIIRYIVEKEVSKASFDKTYPGVVSAVDGNYASVKLMGADTAIPHIENTTGKVLTVGDSVEVQAIRNSLNNLKITFKKDI